MARKKGERKINLAGHEFDEIDERLIDAALRVDSKAVERREKEAEKKRKRRKKSDD